MKEMILKFWKRWFGKEAAGQVMNPVCHETEAAAPKAEKPSAPLPMLERLEAYLFARYDFRFNVLTEQAEYAPKGKEHYQLADQRTLNTLCIEARAAGINCWDKDVSRLLCSQKIKDFHPFTDYMDHLPQWDGTDRVKELAQRVSDTPVWVNGFHRWMLAMAAQWMKMESQCANAVAPLLISMEQGRCKSTFCSRLLPQELQAFYIDKFDITSVSGCEQKLSLFGLINLDEFDRYGERSQATLKNLMQLRKLTFRKSHRSYYSQLPRIASFIGTSNQKELLTDTTGSRRFLCVEVKQKIDCSGIDHTQLYAQLKAELSSGERYWFSAEEEKEIQANNRAFYRQSPVQEIFHKCFRLPADEKEGRLMTAAEIFCRLQKKFLTFAEEVQNRDPRLSQTIRTPGYTRIGQSRVLAPDLSVSVTGYHPIKFVQDPTQAGGNIDRNDYATCDLPVYRYAEVLLNFAEAKAELGTLTQADLDKSINEIRRRVDMPKLYMEQANANPDSYLASAATGYPNVTGTNKGVILEIRRERAIELTQEGFRFDDLVRWKAGNCINQPITGMYFPGPGEYDLTGDGIPDVILYLTSSDKPEATTGVQAYQLGTELILSDADKGYISYHKNIQRTPFNESRDYHYPIPINERSLNKNLVQNPGWEDGLDF